MLDTLSEKRTKSSEEMTVLPPPVQTCEAKQDGIRCQSDASHIYPTSEGINKWLCTDCFYRLLRLIYAWHVIRRESRGAA